MFQNNYADSARIVGSAELVLESHLSGIDLSTPKNRVIRK
jgi:hypothetical protein